MRLFPLTINRSQSHIGALLRPLCLLLGLGTAAGPEPLLAQGVGHHLYVQLGAYTHYGDSEDHEGPPLFSSLELVRPSGWFYGFALFNNSFGQFSQYLYLGKTFSLSKIYEPLHFKLSGGVIHGYKGEFEDKIPLNELGIAPAIIPSIGLTHDRLGVDLVFLATEGLMITVGYGIPW